MAELAADSTPDVTPASAYAELPPRIRVEDMITEQATRDPADPNFDGRDPDNAWMVRHG